MSFLYLFKQLWMYAGKERWKIVLNTALHTVSLLGSLVRPYAFGRAISSLQQHGLDPLEPTLRWLGVYCAGFAIFEGFHRAARHFQITGALAIRRRFVADLYAKLSHLPVKWHTDHHSGAVIHRISQAGAALEDFGVVTDNYLEYALRSIGPIIILAFVSWDIALITFGIAAATMVVESMIRRKIAAILPGLKNAMHRFSALFFDYVSNLRTIITLRMGRRTRVELERQYGLYAAECIRENRINQPRCFLMALGAILVELAVLSFYLWKCGMTGTPVVVGTLIIIFGYLRQISEAIFSMATSFYDLQHWKASFESVAPIRSDADQHQGAPENGAFPWSESQIVGLSFSHDGRTRTLSEISLRLSRGSRIALVGLSGSGKSTLLHLIRGLHHPDSGYVTIDGGAEADLSLLSAVTTLVPQDAEVFENTLLYNITFGVECTEEEIQGAIRAAQFHHVLARMPRGLNTDIREKGVNLSGGEKQRLALARGLLAARGSSIVLLDEPTSSVDPYHEDLIYRGVFGAYAERCIVCAVHQLHVLHRFDTIAVLSQGRIVQTGALQQLLQEEGEFRMLWDRCSVRGVTLQSGGP